MLVIIKEEEEFWENTHGGNSHMYMQRNGSFYFKINVLTPSQ